MKKLTARTSEDWVEIIKERLPPEWWHKIACTVWWDFVSRPAFESTPQTWFREMIDAYVRDRDEMQPDTLGEALRLIGYTEGRIEQVTRLKHWDKKETL